MYLKRKINHATIKVSWIKEPAMINHIIRDLTENDKQKRDFGAVVQVQVMWQFIREKPDEICI